MRRADHLAERMCTDVGAAEAPTSPGSNVYPRQCWGWDLAPRTSPSWPSSPWPPQTPRSCLCGLPPQAPRPRLDAQGRAQITIPTFIPIRPGPAPDVCSLLPCKVVSGAGGPPGFSGPRELLQWGASGLATASMGPVDVGTGGVTLASRGCSMWSPCDLRGGRATVASVPHCFLNKPHGACPQAGTLGGPAGADSHMSPTC